MVMLIHMYGLVCGHAICNLTGAKYKMLNLYLFGFRCSVSVITLSPTLYCLHPPLCSLHSHLHGNTCGWGRPLPATLWWAGLVEREDRTLRDWRGIFSPSWEMGSPTEGNGSQAAVGPPGSPPHPTPHTPHLTPRFTSQWNP